MIDLSLLQDRRETQAVELKDGEKQDLFHENLRLVERLFVDYYSPFIDSRAKYFLVLGWAAYFVFAAYWAFQMAPPVKPEQW